MALGGLLRSGRSGRGGSRGSGSRGWEPGNGNRGGRNCGSGTWLLLLADRDHAHDAANGALALSGRLAGLGWLWLSRGLAARELAAGDLTTGNLTARNLTARELTARELTAGELTTGNLAGLCLAGELHNKDKLAVDGVNRHSDAAAL